MADAHQRVMRQGSTDISKQSMENGQQAEQANRM
jgi:hypothetical protein